MRSVLFHIGPVPIRAYGLMLWIALVVGLIRTIRASKRAGVKSEHVIDIALYGLLAGVVSAHITSILLDLPFYWRDPSEILGLWSGILSSSGGLRGLSFHGGLVGALGAAYLYARRKGISFLGVVDLCTPGLALGYGIVRIGCFLNGCCYGAPTNLPWGIRFQPDPGSPWLTAPSHPTQLYGTLASIVIFAALVRVERRRRFAGQVFFSYLAMYSVYRFLIEFLRKGVTAEVAFAGLTQAQLVSLVVFAATAVLLFSRRTTTSGPAAQGSHAERQPPRLVNPSIRNPKSHIRNSEG